MGAGTGYDEVEKSINRLLLLLLLLLFLPHLVIY
jgi:hypothetical protein